MADRLSLTIDAKDWAAMGQLFTDTVVESDVVVVMLARRAVAAIR